MDLKPVKPINTQCNTNANKQPEISPQQAKQVSYVSYVSYVFTFKDLMNDLMLEQREQM